MIVIISKGSGPNTYLSVPYRISIVPQIVIPVVCSFLVIFQEITMNRLE